MSGLVSRFLDTAWNTESLRQDMSPDSDKDIYSHILTSLNLFKLTFHHKDKGISQFTAQGRDLSISN